MIKLNNKLENTKKSNLKIMLGFDCDRPRGKFINTEEGIKMAKIKFDSIQRISKTLEELEISRTFFVCGQFLESMTMVFGKEEMKKAFCVNSQYVEIGDHSYSHNTVKKILTRPDKNPISPEEVENEFKKNTKIFKDIFGLKIPNRAYRTPLGHADGLKDNEKLQKKLKKIGVKYVSSDLRDADDGLNPPLVNKDNTPRQPYYYKNGLLEIPSAGWQDTVFSKTSKTPTKVKTPETYEEIINYYTGLFEKALSIAEGSKKEYFLGLVLHPYDNSFYNINNRFFYDLNKIATRINAQFCKYEDVLQKFG